MDTIKLYQQDVYMKECTAAVTAADGNIIQLDRTIFFPTGGGQSCDLGTIGGQEVTEVFEEGEQVFHRLAEGCMQPSASL